MVLAYRNASDDGRKIGFQRFCHVTYMQRRMQKQWRFDIVNFECDYLDLAFWGKTDDGRTIPPGFQSPSLKYYYSKSDHGQVNADGAQSDPNTDGHLASSSQQSSSVIAQEPLAASVNEGNSHEITSQRKEYNCRKSDDNDLDLDGRLASGGQQTASKRKKAKGCQSNDIDVRRSKRCKGSK